MQRVEKDEVFPALFSFVNFHLIFRFRFSFGLIGFFFKNEGDQKRKGREQKAEKGQKSQEKEWEN